MAVLSGSCLLPLSVLPRSTLTDIDDDLATTCASYIINVNNNDKTKSEDRAPPGSTAVKQNCGNNGLKIATYHCSATARS